jgi:hypothetical protein
MPSLVSHAEKGDWEKCHAMLRQGLGDVHGRGKVRSVLTPASDDLTCRHSCIFLILPACACLTPDLPSTPL